MLCAMSDHALQRFVITLICVFDLTACLSDWIIIHHLACTNAILTVTILKSFVLSGCYPPSFERKKIFYFTVKSFIHSQLDVAKLAEYVMAWQQDLRYVECRLEDFGQKLVTRPQNIKVQ